MLCPEKGASELRQEVKRLRDLRMSALTRGLQANNGLIRT